ncbi:TetR/AcrR family transcriptional regulator [Pseudomonas sp. N040]|uniref:TetR/AcrR family transcriptional regulator n=1 Tax=Pseudomonas sp. N040 TaxID=2785325 RepID=UPI0018A28EDB|nr:TetR/AcrR family transcriptional regulator [Pseudomonas sp. N040]MBF7730041.1 TetR/AcrR family transcriptional regulator [Pseudomonas sp. N040]MBW7013683.1 TetR/AcrR family transcriptional regulator [Pseudomonas sp. N040]
MSKPGERPRPPSSRKPRASSQARIAAILAAVRAQLAEQGTAALSIYSVAERAGIPPSSVYHFFASVPALLEALTSEVHAAFRACLQAPVDHAALRDWRDLSRIVELRTLETYAADPAAMQLILAQHGLTEVTRADRRHDVELGRQLQQLFARHFQLPPLPVDIDIFTLALELSDRVYASSVQEHGRITPRMAEEGMRVFDAYLALYLPPHLPKHDTPTA